MQFFFNHEHRSFLSWCVFIVYSNMHTVYSCIEGTMFYDIFIRWQCFCMLGQMGIMHGDVGVGRYV